MWLTEQLGVCLRRAVLGEGRRKENENLKNKRGGVGTGSKKESGPLAAP